MKRPTFRAESQHPRGQTLFWMVLILLMGAALRLFHLNAVPLRGDEAFTVLHWMREPLGQTLANIATVDPQPPLAYALYRGYGLVVGSGELVVRFLPALLNLLGIPAMYGVGKRVAGRRAGLIAAALFALSPVILWHAQDARNYGVWVACSALALWLALRALERGRRIDWALFVAIQIVACYLYYLELLFLGALTIYVLTLARTTPRNVFRWFGALTLIGFALAPWFLQPRLLSGGGYGGTAGGLDLTRYLTWFAPSLLFGEAIPNQRMAIFSGAAIATLVVGFALLWRIRRAWVILFGVYAAVPLAALGVVSLRLNVFVPRYVLPIALVMIVLAAVIIERGFRFRNRSTPLRVLAMALPVMLGWSLFSYYFDYAKSPDWRALAAYLAPRTSAGDLLVNSAADMSFPFYQDAYRVAGTEAQLPANPGQPEDEIAEVLASALDGGHAVWIVAQPPPGWPNANEPDRWLAQHALPLRSAVVNGLRADQYLPAVITIDAPPLATFDDAVRLLRATVELPLEPDGSLPLVLDFEVITETENPLKTFVHLVGPHNPATGTPLWAQDDQPPRDSIDTTRWRPGERYRDVFHLPGLDQLPSGEYQLVVGWYDPATNQRLLAGGTDAYPIAILIVSSDKSTTLRNP